MSQIPKFHFHFLRSGLLGGLGLLSLIWSLPASEPVVQLPPLTVTSSPVVGNSSLDEAASIVDIVGRQQLEDLNAQDLAAGLRRVPGLTISRYNVVGSFGGGGGGAIFVRGHGSGRPGSDISVRVDGIPQVMSLWSHPLLDTISLEQAGAIEIYKSPQPVLFGNMSFAVINLLPQTIEPQTQVSAGFGKYGTWSESLSHSGRSGKLAYRLAAGHQESDGHREDAEGLTNHLNGRLEYDFSAQWQLSLQANHTDSWANDPSSAPVERYDTDTELYILTLSHNYDQIQGHLKLHYEDGRAYWKNDSDPGLGKVNSTYHYDNYGFKLQERLTLNSGSRLVVGLDQDYYDVSGEKAPLSGATATEVIDRMQRQTAPYAMLSHSFGEAIQLTPSIGIRYTDSRYFGSAVSWQSGLKLQLERTEFYANFARAVNYPGLYSEALPGSTAWEALKPEELDHHEIGLIQQLNHTVSLSLSLFYDHVREGLSNVATSGPPTLVNLDSYHTRGAEVSLRLQPCTSLNLFAGATWQYANRGDLPNLPRWTCSTGAVWTPSPSWRFTCDAEFVDRHLVLEAPRGTAYKEVDAYLILNAKLSYLFTAPSGQWRGELFLAGENLTDTDYEYRPDYPMAGISWSTGLKLTF
jgi:iron complex outermembrane receptor protein